ncbi:MAG TPA: hypothetical protein VIV60_20545 [Polyangiaceae bacterium]
MTPNQLAAVNQSLLHSVSAAFHYAWQRRNAIALLLVLLWVPTELCILFVPEQRSTLVRLGLEGLVEPLWTAALIHLRRHDAAAFQGRVQASAMQMAMQALHRARRSYARLVGIRTVLEFRLWFGLLSLVVPGVIMFTRYAFMDVLAVVRNVGPTSCRQRSAALVEGRGVGILMVLLAGMLIPMGISELFDWCVEGAASRSLSVCLRVLAMLPTVVLPLALFEIYAASSKSAMACSRHSEA